MTDTIRSDAFVFFGATGDLAYKKIFPALQGMIRRGHLDVPIIGVAKQGWGIEQLRDRIRASLTEHGGGVDERAFTKLSERLAYVDGDYNDLETFRQLSRKLGDAKHPVHYLAIPPSLFPVVVQNLAASGSAKGARVIIEKPFGRDLASARQLNRTLHEVFDESAIFRIDHYLGKEAVQNLVVFRFANTFLEPVWNRNYIESIQITMAESFGVQGRGSFYEEAGAIRDVVQNHLLSVVGFLAMEPPATTYNESIRDELVKVFRQIAPLDVNNIVRGQFDGYQREPGVKPGSNVETFAAMRLDIDSWRWADVPFFIRAGKCMPVTETEVMVDFKRPPITKLARGTDNYVRLRLTPDLKIALGARVKRPGDEMVGEPTELSLLEQPKGDEVGAYERLLGEAIDGDPALFSRQDAVEAAWKVVEPALDLEKAVEPYSRGSWGPAACDLMTRDVGGWLSSQPLR
ncbi:MAG TPA: glucose-6-phosphate dehydrogenase [Polyangiaceae bacterium]